MLIKIKNTNLYCDVYGISVLLEKKNKDISLIVYLNECIEFLELKDIEILNNKFINGFFNLETYENFSRISFSEYKDLCDYDYFYNLYTGYSYEEEIDAKKKFFEVKEKLKNEFLMSRIKYIILNDIVKFDYVDTVNKIATYYFVNDNLEIYYQKNIETDEITRIEILKDKRSNENILI